MAANRASAKQKKKARRREGIRPLKSHVADSLDAYFSSLNGHPPPNDLYDMVLEQVEKPLLEAVLEYSDFNQTRAAEILGINRGTLRKKLRLHGLQD